MTCYTTPFVATHNRPPGEGNFWGPVYRYYWRWILIWSGIDEMSPLSRHSHTWRRHPGTNWPVYYRGNGMSCSRYALTGFETCLRCHETVQTPLTILSQVAFSSFPANVFYRWPEVKKATDVTTMTTPRMRTKGIVSIVCLIWQKVMGNSNFFCPNRPRLPLRWNVAMKCHNHIKLATKCFCCHRDECV